MRALQATCSAGLYPQGTCHRVVLLGRMHLSVAYRARRRRRAPGIGKRRLRRQCGFELIAKLAESVERYAAEHHTSLNDALVRLAYDGATAYDREHAAASLARSEALAEYRERLDRLVDEDGAGVATWDEVVAGLGLTEPGQTHLRSPGGDANLTRVFRIG